MVEENRSKIKVKGKIVVKSDLDTVSNVPYNSVPIRNLIDGNVTVAGAVTGRVYFFPGAGSVAQVDVADKDELLNKKRGRACCGNASGASIFELVE